MTCKKTALHTEGVQKFINIKYNRKLQFVYDASGAKLRKIANDNGTITTYDYVNGVEYTNNTLERIPHTEGEIVKNGSGNYVYEYTLKDHLGNTRVTFGDADNNGVVENSDIKQINSFYPFGLNMEGPGFGAQGANKYGYNQKELNSDFGLNWNDYGARFYDASIGRFPMVDPLSEVYRKQNPYTYAANNPVSFIDFMGMGPMGADGQTNEQWMSSSNPANHGSEATSSAYQGSAHGQATYEKMRGEAEHRARDGASRDITNDDIALTMVIYNVYKSKTPFIHFNTLLAQMLKPKFLTYAGGKGFAIPNRRKATKPFGFPRNLNGLLSIEEYPYACTLEGGEGAICFPVPVGEQDMQRSELSKVTRGLKKGDIIFVKLVDDSGVKVPVPMPYPDPQGDYKPFPLIPVPVYQQVPEAIMQRIFMIVVPFVQGIEWELPRSPMPNKGV